MTRQMRPSVSTFGQGATTSLSVRVGIASLAQKSRLLEMVKSVKLPSGRGLIFT